MSDLQNKLDKVISDIEKRLTNKEDFEYVKTQIYNIYTIFLDEFDKLIGINKIGCVHINDSKNTISSKKDRHENIGLGYIGFNNLIDVIYNKRLDNIPMILETPYIKDENTSYPPYKYEIEMIRNKKFNENLIEDIKHYYKESK